MSWNKWRSFGRYIIGSRVASWIVAVLLLLLLGAGVLGWLDLKYVGEQWNEYGDPFVGLATFLVAGLVWWGEARQDWLASMPCKLTAIFTFEGREVMRCDRADLASEGDIRALGQQLGRHMNEGQDLKMALPALRRSGGHPEEGPNGKVYRHWTVQFTLLELPEKLVDIPKEEVLLWKPPFEKEPSRVQRSA